MGILYKAEIDEWMRRKNKYGDNLKKYYNLVFSYCFKVMNNRIETRPTYHSTIQDNPIELSNTIKLIIHYPQRTNYPYEL